MLHVLGYLSNTSSVNLHLFETVYLPLLVRQAELLKTGYRSCLPFNRFLLASLQLDEPNIKNHLSSFLLLIPLFRDFLNRHSLSFS